MSRVWVSVGALLLVAEALTILVGGIISGGWMWGLLFGLVGIGVTVEWLRLRKSNASTQVVADRMIGGTMIVLLGLAVQAMRMAAL